MTVLADDLDEGCAALATWVKLSGDCTALRRVLYFHAVRADGLLADVVTDVVTDVLCPLRASGHHEVLYRVLLRELGYAEDFDLAELEIELEGEGRLPAFEELRLVPDLDDGVVLSAAPLHALIPSSWMEPAKYWQQLRQGKYAWSNVARQIFGDGARGRSRTQ